MVLSEDNLLHGAAFTERIGADRADPVRKDNALQQGAPGKSIITDGCHRVRNLSFPEGTATIEGQRADACHAGFNDHFPDAVLIPSGGFFNI